MRFSNIIFVVLFILFAALQYNDPDPYVWIPLYLYAAVLCWLAFNKKYYPTLYLAGIAVYLVYAAYLFFVDDGMLDWMAEHDSENIAQSMKATKPWIEATREVFGLMIMVIVLLTDYIYARRGAVARRG